MSEADGDNHRRNDIWHDESLYAPRPAQLQPSMAGNNMYMMAGAHHNQYVGNMQANHMHPQQIHSYHEAGTMQQNEGYTMLPMGHGNFLKVYHNNEETPNFNNFNNYELFSNHSFIPQHMVKSVQQQPQPQQQQAQQQPQQQPNHQQQVNAVLDNYYHQHVTTATRSEPTITDTNANASDAPTITNNCNTNNMFINQLVENWVPNMSGTYTPFGEPPPAQQPHHPAASIAATHKPSQIGRNNSFEVKQNDIYDYGASGQTNAGPNITFNTNQLHQNIEEIPSSHNNCVHIKSNAPSSRTNGSFQHDSKIKGGHEMKKPRMVAEVKPMRMSYSDVLSKNVIINEQNAAMNSANGGSNTPTNGAMANNTNTHKTSKSSEKGKSGHYDKKGNADDKEGFASHKANAKNNNGATGNGSSQGSAKDSKVSPITDFDFGKDLKLNDIDLKKGKRNSGSSGIVINKPATVKTAKSVQPEPVKKRSQSQPQGSLPQQPAVEKETEKDMQNNGYFYNVTKNENSQTDKGAAKSNNQSKKYGTVKSSSFTSTTRTVTVVKGEKSSNYQQKRIQKSRKSTTYEMVAKLLGTWADYLIRFLGWLVWLVYDVVVLGFSMIWERISTAYCYTCQVSVTLWKDLRSNSGRPSAFCWRLWHDFDKRFGKDSKWAFWRQLTAKKKPPEPVPDYYKNGRLPQTGDEAMYSLLNCKGKDAYRYACKLLTHISIPVIRSHFKYNAVENVFQMRDRIPNIAIT